MHPKVAQSIIRHSKIDLTMTRYTHVLRGQESEAVAKLPDLSLPSIKQQRATGTDNRPVSADQKSNPEQLTPQLTPKLTPTAYPRCNQLSAGDTDKRNVPKIAKGYNDLTDRNLCVKNDNLSPADTDNGEGGIRTRGTGLYPYDGLANRCLKPLGHLSEYL